MRHGNDIGLYIFMPFVQLGESMETNHIKPLDLTDRSCEVVREGATIDASGFSNGIYIVQIQILSGRTLVEKIIKHELKAQ